VTDDRDLEGLDPYDLMDAEANRLDRFFATLRGPDWERPSRCEGWSVRDVLAHLTAGEEYNRACLEGTVSEFLAGVGARGATDLATANEIGIRDFDGSTPEQLLDTWRTRSAENRRRLRTVDGANVDTSVGAYPARWQAFHLAFELAVHADDAGVPVTAGEEPARTAWQSQVARFALKEAKPGAAIEDIDGKIHVRGDGFNVEVTDAEFVRAAAARLPDDSDLDAEARAYLSVTP
jgi:uncharacterized protein (TIGR03083 family)